MAAAVPAKCCWQGPAAVYAGSISITKVVQHESAQQHILQQAPSATKTSIVINADACLPPLVTFAPGDSPELAAVGFANRPAL
jgi:hypothetical protein